MGQPSSQLRQACNTCSAESGSPCMGSFPQSLHPKQFFNSMLPADDSGEPMPHSVSLGEHWTMHQSSGVGHAIPPYNLKLIHRNRGRVTRALNRNAVGYLYRPPFYVTLHCLVFLILHQFFYLIDPKLVKAMVPFWVPIIVGPKCFGGSQNRDHHFDDPGIYPLAYKRLLPVSYILNCTSNPIMASKFPNMVAIGFQIPLLFGIELH